MRRSALRRIRLRTTALGPPWPLLLGVLPAPVLLAAALALRKGPPDAGWIVVDAYLAGMLLTGLLASIRLVALRLVEPPELADLLTLPWKYEDVVRERTWRASSGHVVALLCVLGSWLAVSQALRPPAVAVLLTVPLVALLFVATWTAAGALALTRAGRRLTTWTPWVLMFATLGPIALYFGLDGPLQLAPSAASRLDTILLVLPTHWLVRLLRTEEATAALGMATAIAAPLLAVTAVLRSAAIRRARDRYGPWRVVEAQEAMHAYELSGQPPPSSRFSRWVERRLGRKRMAAWRLVEIQPHPERIERVIGWAVFVSGAWCVGVSLAHPHDHDARGQVLIVMLPLAMVVLSLLPRLMSVGFPEHWKNFGGMSNDGLHVRHPLHEILPVERPDLALASRLQLVKVGVLIACPVIFVLAARVPGDWKLTAAAGTATFLSLLAPLVASNALEGMRDPRRILPQGVEPGASAGCFGSGISVMAVLVLVIWAYARSSWLLAVLAVTIVAAWLVAWPTWRRVERMHEERAFDAEHE